MKLPSAISGSCSGCRLTTASSLECFSGSPTVAGQELVASGPGDAMSQSRTIQHLSGTGRGILRQGQICADVEQGA